MVKPTIIIRIFFLICIALAIAYWNSINSPWMFDDKHTILNNQSLHLIDLSLQSIKQTFYSSQNAPETLYRPLACLSFALNWYWGQDNVTGYHLVNTAIHLFGSVFLYLSCIQILNTPAIAEKYSPHSKHLIALIATLMWSLNPIQTQAVTYIVQRMAALAAMFSIIGIYFFLKARLSQAPKQKILFSCLCLLSFFCAFASKENAILFPISLLLIEYVFFDQLRDLRQFTQKNKKLYYALAAIVIGCFFFLGMFYLIPSLDYSSRTFTLSERLLTEPRILIFYLSLIFFPLASRLSLEHDFVISTYFFTPTDTFAAILTCIILIILGLTYTKKYPLFSLAILFFFLNHVVESTIIPLELIFEHRNYLPSLFIFLPFSAFFIKIATNENRMPLKIIAPTLLAVLIVFLGFNTYTRNKSWATELTLLEDAHAKAPNNSRAASNLAKEYIQKNRLLEAMELLEISYHQPQSSKNHAEAVSLNGQGVIYNIQGSGEKAVECFEKSLQYIPDYTEARGNLIRSLTKLNRLQEALALFQMADSKSGFHDTSLQAVVLLRLNRPQEALELFRSASPENILSIEFMQGIGKSLSMLGHNKQADFFLRQAAKFSLTAAFCQVENLIHAEELEKSRLALIALFSQYPFQAISDQITAPDLLGLPINTKMLYPIIMRQAKEIVQAGSLK